MKQFTKVNFQKIAIIVVIGGLFLAVLGGVYFLNKKYYGQMEDSLVNDFFAPAQKLQAEQIAKALEDQVGEIKNVLKTAAGYRNLQEISLVCRPNQESAVNGVKIALADIVDHVSLIDKSGKIICSTDKAVEGKDISVFAHIQEILETHRPIISRLFMNPVGKRMVAMAVPLFSQKGDFVGILGAAIDIKTLESQLTKDFKFTPSAYNTLLDDDGTVLYHPNPDFVGENIFGEKIQKATGGNPELNNMLKKMMLGKTGYDFYIFENENKVAGYAPVELLNGDRFWSVDSTAKIKEYSHITEPFVVKSLIANLLTIIFGFSLAFIVIYLINSIKRDSRAGERERERVKGSAAKRIIQGKHK